MQCLELRRTLFDDTERLAVCNIPLRIDTLEYELLVEHPIDIEGDTVPALDRREDDGCTDARDLHRVEDRLGGYRDDIDNDIDALTAGNRVYTLHDIFHVRLDGVVRSERPSNLEFFSATRCARHDDRAGAGAARRHNRAQTALSMPEDEDAVAKLGLRNLDGPTDARGERLIEGCERNRHLVGKPMQHGSLVQMHVLAVAAPETVADIGRRKPISGRRARRHQRMAVDVVTAQAHVAAPARKIGLDGNPISRLDTPDAHRIRADIDDAPD